jgi:predicted dehydrogenase
LKIGLIGCGRIANEAHVPAYPIAGTSLTAVCDLDNHRASAVAERTGASVSPDSLTLAQRDDVDIIDIATPPSQRPDLLRELIKVGKPILTQKPLSYDLNTAAALAREADDHGVVLAVNHNARWAPNHRAVYERLHNGDLGEVFAIQHHNRFSENVDTWRLIHAIE